MCLLNVCLSLYTYTMNENEMTNKKTYTMTITHQCEECGEGYTEDGPLTCYECPGMDVIRIAEPYTITV